MKVVFIAGPLSGISNGQELSQGEQRLNVEYAAAVGIALLRQGYAPIVPHLSWYIDPNTKYHEWYAADLEFVRHSDAVLRLAGPSVGADNEVAEAVRLGIPVYYTVAELLQGAGL